VKLRTTTGRPRLGGHAVAGGVYFAVYAHAKSCAAVLVGVDDRELDQIGLDSLDNGYFEAFVPGVDAGARYYFLVDGRRLPDPYARFLPCGVHGPAQVIAPPDRVMLGARARPLREQVIYELHVGTFTDGGTYAAAEQRLPALVELGVTTLELMPVAAFAGRRGWGYDGVALFAPHAAYGTPEELRRFIEVAHGFDLGVFLDVVYNHFGPSGNYLAAYAPSYFCRGLHNDWGNVPNFEDPALRELVLENARYWLGEFGFDGLRLDATHAIVDHSPRHILRELRELAQSFDPPRILVAEDERNLAALVTDVQLDAIWADDFHHQCRVTVTGERNGYYGSFEPGALGLARAIERGWLYEGQYDAVKGERRGTPADALLAQEFVYCIQNHDQIGNRAFGDRLTASIDLRRYRGLSLLLCFLPMTPLLFMGQEWAATTPFCYFTDHDAELGPLVSEGRRREFAGFPEFSDSTRREEIPDPQAEATFWRSRLNWSERERDPHRAVLELYRGALALRRNDVVLRESGREGLSAEAIGQVLVVRRELGNDVRVLFLNLGEDAIAVDVLHPQTALEGANVIFASEESRGCLEPGQALVLAGTRAAAGVHVTPAE
jgi:maltooligosyltrehalose trehalohydrolase